MRWDPVMIRWCIYLRHLSGSAYELIRQSGVVSLPSQRTLRDYTYYTTASHGFSSESPPFQVSTIDTICYVGDVDKQIMTTANLEASPEREKYVIIMIDEMHIKDDIVYDKHTGSFVIVCFFVVVFFIVLFFCCCLLFFFWGEGGGG